jgi:hypothetical protein
MRADGERAQWAANGTGGRSVSDGTTKHLYAEYEHVYAMELGFHLYTMMEGKDASVAARALVQALFLVAKGADATGFTVTADDDMHQYHIRLEREPLPSAEGEEE